MVKHVLKTTKFNKSEFFGHAVKRAMDENDVEIAIGSYYLAIVAWKEPNFHCTLKFEGDLDPLTLDEGDVVEDDDHLLTYPSASTYCN
jgi:hypothetical protein